MSSAKACLVPVGGFWDSYRFTSSIHPSIFSLSSSSLHLPGDRMCLKRDDFFAPVDGPYRLLSLLHDSKPFALSVFRTIMKGSPSSKFCNTLFAWDDFSSKSSTGSAVPMPKAAQARSIVTVESWSSAHVKTFSKPFPTRRKLKRWMTPTWFSNARSFHCPFLCTFFRFSYSTVVDQRHGFLFVAFHRIG